jgi:lysophospholipase L1-like esterase
MFVGGHGKSLRLAPLYAEVARQRSAAFLNAGDIIRSSAYDGIHLDADAHVVLARAVGEKIRALGW